MIETLYLDTSDSIICGLIDTSGNWIQYKAETQNKKAISLHLVIHELLELEKIKIKDIKNVISVVGPGSYTGIRLSHGFSQIMNWSGVKTYSFHHFEVPSLLGVKQGLWVTSAYKNEWFVYQWGEEQGPQYLLFEYELMKDFLKNTDYSKLKYFCYNLEFLNQFDVDLPHLEFKTTPQIIKEKIGSLSKVIIEQNKKVEPYYFRPLDKEFKRMVAKQS